ncbi:MAG TPA: hypothetical protein VD968_20170, partial [Pyrinomonadaceae bacterium]|nr:hypothetical protein [Pyrinomonadaceae bacterium]
EFAAVGRMKQLAGQFTKGLPGGARFRQVIYHSHSVGEVLDRIGEYFETVAAGRFYVGEGTEPEEEAPALDSCEAATTTF